MRRARRPLLALAALLVVQWVLVAVTAQSTTADDAGRPVLVLNVVVLLPVALACVYLIAAQLGGARLGLLAALVWVVTPYVLSPLWDARYEPAYEDGFLPLVLGLTDDGEFRAMVVLLVAALLAARAVRGGSVAEAAGAGLAASLATVLDVSAVLFLAAPALALAAARRRRALPAHAAALVPGVLALVLRDPTLPWWPGADVWDNLHQNFLGIQEFFWSVRILQFLPLAGVIAVARRSIPVAVLLGWWFGAYLLFRGGDPDSTIGSGTFLPALLPAVPAYLLLAAAIPLLAPPLPSWREAARRVPRPPFLRTRRS